jgi:hypothetical protein
VARHVVVFVASISSSVSSRSGDTNCIASTNSNVGGSKGLCKLVVLYSIESTCPVGNIQLLINWCAFIVVMISLQCYDYRYKILTNNFLLLIFIVHNSLAFRHCIAIFTNNHLQIIICPLPLSLSLIL